MALRATILCIPKIRQVLQISLRQNSSILSKYNGNFVLSFYNQSIPKTVALSSMCSKTVAYDDVKEATKNSAIYIIDVREPSELTASGQIPNSLNIPLGDIANVLGTLPDCQFETKYGRSKPDHATPIIFSCQLGKRAGMAAEAAIKLGYENSKIYSGSWLDWAKHQ